MNILRMVFKEMRQHRLNLTLSVLSVVAVAACLGGVSTLLNAYNARNQALLDANKKELDKRMAALEDDYRKITKNMGFNVLILPKDQNLSEFFGDSYASKFMPEAYVYKLAESSIITIQHLLPSLQQKVKWPEYERTILLSGVRDEVPISLQDQKSPIEQPVPEGGVVLGAELGESLKLAEGDTVKLMGREFKVTKVHEERGTIDDITVWIDLTAAQEILDKKGQINGILALECGCALGDLPKIRSEIAQILPDTQVIEKSSQALGRAEARWRAEEENKLAKEQEAAQRAQLQRERESLAGTVLPLVVAAAAVWIGFLAWSNVRERRPEIGILRAMGWRGGQIMWLFLGRSAVVGALGGVSGFMIGAGVALAWAQGQEQAAEAVLGPALINPALFLGTALLAPFVAIAAGWIPAQLAALEDPAEILRAE